MMKPMMLLVAVLLFASTAAAVPLNLKSTNGVLGVVGWGLSVTMLCSDGIIYYGEPPREGEGGSAPGSWTPQGGPVPVPVESIADFFGNGFVTNDGTVWVWGIRTIMVDPGSGDGVISPTYRDEYFWAPMPLLPCQSGPISTQRSTMSGIKGLFR